MNSRVREPPVSAATRDGADARQRLLALRLRERGLGTAEESLKPRLPDEPVPLSFSQEGLWFLDQLDGPGSAYNVTRALRLHGRIEATLLERCLRALVQRHESLRTAFDTREGSAVQIVRPAREAAAAFRFETLSLDGYGSAEIDDALDAASRAAADEPIDLSRPPLFRAKLVRIGDDDHVLILVVHHIVCDGWSIGILLRELGALYAARADGAALPPLPVQFPDFALWQRRRLTTATLEAQLQYWRVQLANTPDLELPTDRPRPVHPSRRAGTEPFIVAGTLLDSLHALARGHDATLFMVLLAAFQVLLMRQSRQDDIAVGVPLASRNRLETEGVVGYFVNTLVMRSALAGEPGFVELLQQMRKTVLDAFEHQEVPFERLVAELCPQRDASRNPLYQVAFSLQSQPPAVLTIEGVRTEALALAGNEAKFDLLLTLTETGGALHGTIVYAADLFDAVSMNGFARQFQTLLAAIVADPTTSIRRLPLLDDADREHVLCTWNATGRPYDPALPVHTLIERQVRLTPEAVALTFGEEWLTYRELDARSNRLSRHLRARGIRRGMLVGLAVERGTAMVVAQLAILKAGAGYVPLDPSYPTQRLAFMIDDAQLALLVTTSHRLDTFAQPRERCVLVDVDRAAIAAHSEERLQADEAVDSGPDDPAYVIYTSGSTGRPKGVVLRHRSLSNLVASVIREPGYRSSDRVLAITTMSFDIAAMELLVPLTVGAEIVIASRDQARDGQALRELLERSGANFMQATPLTWRLLVDAGWEGARNFRAITGGEALSQVLAANLLERVGELWNGYGPSETTVYSTFWRVSEPERGISIGRPIANTVVRVLDEYGQLCPPGLSGEIYIGGDGLALGYLGQPGLTAERFVADAFSDTPGALLYRTGDQGRWRHDGRLEHQGRLDFQVKLRGYRIELGEIEAHLSAHADVAQSAVVMREDASGDPCLVAYVVGGDKAPSARDLRTHLRARLPDFMVPQHFVQLDALPRLPNGKTDRKALPALNAAPVRQRSQSRPSGLEETIARVWCEVLNLPRVDAHDDFFEIGGHSILAARTVARLRQALGRDVPLRLLFESPTVAELARRIGDDAVSEQDVCPPLSARARSGVFPASLSQASLWFLNELAGPSGVYNIPRAFLLSGALDLAALAASVQALVERHASLRTGFELRDGAPVQVVREFDRSVQAVPIELVPVQGATADQRERFVDTKLRSMAGEPFDLARPPLIRLHVLRVHEREHVLLMVVHHIVSDGWSMNILMHELGVLYRAFHAGERNPLAPLPLQFADYVAAPRTEEDAAFIADDLAYWRRQLAGLKPLELATDRPFPPQRSYRGAACLVEIGPALLQTLETLGRKQGVTVFMTLLAAMQVLLMSYSGQEDIAVGTPIAGRNRADLEAIVGYFVNTLVLRVDLSGNPTFAQLLTRVRSVCLSAFSHHALPFDRLVAELSPERDLRRNPLYQVSLALQNAPDAGRDFGTLETQRVIVHSGTSKFDLFLSLTEDRGGLSGPLEYNSDVFDAATAERIAADFVRILERVAAAPEQPIRGLCADRTRAPRPVTIERVPPSSSPVTVHPPLACGNTVDVRVLPVSPVANDGRQATCSTAVGEDLEERLKTLWQSVLQSADVGLDDNFFELGGHSLLAIRLIDTINKTLKSSLRVASLFHAPTIRGQASLLRGRGTISTCLVTIQAEGDEPPLFIVPGYGSALGPFHGLARALGPEQPLYVADLDSVRADVPESVTLESVAANVLESMRRIQPHGPYRLAGYSLGGRIAYEIAQQIHLRGDGVSLLAMIDCSAPGYPRVQSFIPRALLHVKQGLRLAPTQSGMYFMARIRALKKYLRPVRVYPAVFNENVVERRTAAAQAMQARAQVLYDAWRIYKASPYRGTLSIVRASVRPWRLGVVDDDPHLGWDELVGERIQLAHMDCTHPEMLESRHVPALAKVLRGWLAVNDRVKNERNPALTV